MTQPELLRFYAPPVLALALLQFLVLATLGTLRLTGIARRQSPLKYFKLLQRPEGVEFPQHAEAAARNFINLFEMPVLFYALVPLIVLAGIEHGGLLTALWVFVALRYAHSAIHLTVNEVRLRFMVYAASCATLLVAWVLFAGQVL